MSSRPVILCCSTGFLPADSFGGLPYSTFYLCRALIHAGADVRVVTTDTNGQRSLDVATDRWTTYDGIRVWYAATNGGPFLFGRSAAAAIAGEMPRVDCVINSGTLWVHAGWLAWRVAKRHRRPSLNYPRGLLDAWAYHHKAMRKQVYFHAVGKRILEDSAAIVALTEWERQRLSDLHIRTRIEVIPNGAGPEPNSESVPRAWLDAHYPALAGRRYVLFLGRLHEKKGLDLLLGAIAGLADPHMAFVIAGPVDPAFQSRWEELQRTHRLEQTLILPGAVRGTAKAAWLDHADVFVLPSYSEGMPVAVLEALRAGCPVVISRACGLPEVERAGAGLVIDPDVDQLTGALRALLIDERRRRAMVDRARSLAQTAFNWDAIGAQTLALCQEVIECASVKR